MFINNSTGIKGNVCNTISFGIKYVIGQIRIIHFLFFFSPFLIEVALYCPPEKLIEMFGYLYTKIATPSLIKANRQGITALHALCQNRYFTGLESNTMRNMEIFKYCLKWLIET